MRLLVSGARIERMGFFDQSANLTKLLNFSELEAWEVCVWHHVQDLTQTPMRLSRALRHVGVAQPSLTQEASIGDRRVLQFLHQITVRLRCHASRAYAAMDVSFLRVRAGLSGW